MDERFNVIAPPIHRCRDPWLALETELGVALGADPPARRSRQFTGISRHCGRGHNLRQRPQLSLFMRHGQSRHRPSSVPQWTGCYFRLAGWLSRRRPIRHCPFHHAYRCAAFFRRRSPTGFHIAERETLLSDGIATHTVDRAGVVSLERMVTTYQTATGGVAGRCVSGTLTRCLLCHSSGLRLRSADRDQVFAL